MDNAKLDFANSEEEKQYQTCSTQIKKRFTNAKVVDIKNIWDTIIKGSLSNCRKTYLKLINSNEEKFNETLYSIKCSLNFA